MITFKPTNKGYKKASIGQIIPDAKLITCLNTSEVNNLTDENGRKFKKLVTRFYSMKAKGKLIAHAPRVMLDSVYTTVSESTRLKVCAKRSKDPHAFIHGNAEVIASNQDETHEQLIDEMLKQGAVYIAYDPYKVEQFVIVGAESSKLPANCDHLIRLTSTKAKPTIESAYCFEDGILAILSI